MDGPPLVDAAAAAAADRGWDFLTSRLSTGNPDDSLCTLGDVTLSVADALLLRPGSWLNDNLIAFYFDFLAGEQPHTHSSSSSSNGSLGKAAPTATSDSLTALDWAETMRRALGGGGGGSSGSASSATGMDGLVTADDMRGLWSRAAEEVLFVHPGSIFMSQFVDAGQLRQILGDLATQLGRRKLIFFPINDNGTSEAVGGSHWTLLVFSRGDPTALRPDRLIHFDSLNGGRGSRNFRMAQESVLPKFLPIIGATDAVLESGECTRQPNSSDCGAFVLANARRYAASWLAGLPPRLVDVPADEASRLRLEIRDIAVSIARASTGS